jgi:hypothetical protein
MNAHFPGAGDLVQLAEALPSVPENLRPFVILRHHSFLNQLQQQARIACPARMEPAQLVNMAWIKLKQTWKSSAKHQHYFRELVPDPPSFAGYLCRMIRIYVGYSIKGHFRSHQRRCKLMRKVTPPLLNTGTCQVTEADAQQFVEWLQSRANTPEECALLQARLNQTSISELARRLRVTRSRLSECWQSFQASARDGLQELLASRSLL